MFTNEVRVRKKREREREGCLNMEVGQVQSRSVQHYLSCQSLQSVLRGLVANFIWKSCDFEQS